jgi:hypothetical protein
VVKGSALAASLVIKQCATSVASAAKVLMEHPQSLTDLVFIVIEEGEGRKHHMVWQIVAFQEATQKVVSRRVSEHETLKWQRRPLSLSPRAKC